MANGDNINSIWDGFETDDAFKQRVKDSFKTIPCKTHASKLSKLSARNTGLLIFGFVGGFVVIVEGAKYLIEIIRGIAK